MPTTTKPVVIATKTKAILCLLLIFMGWKVMEMPSWAHAELVTATPTIGAIYWWDVPNRVRLTFTEPLNIEKCTIMVIRPDFSTIAVSEKTGDAQDSHTVSVDLPPLSPGRYSVIWRSASTTDGDMLTGSYDFVVLERETAIQRSIQWTLIGMVVMVLGVAGWRWYYRRYSSGRKK